MKVLTVLILIHLCSLCQAQQKLTFAYDLAGNQITRVLCVNCASKTVKEIKDIEVLKEEDFQKFSNDDLFSYYPNPVKEELYLQWQLIEENQITDIKVFSVSGQLLKNYKLNKGIGSLIIPFQNYSSGVYFLLLIYKNGEEKSIKIIKQ